MFSSDLIRNEFITFVATLYDLLWFNRNSVAQGSSSLSAQDLVFKATKSAEDHWKSILSSSTASRSFSNQTWPRGLIKISTDTTFAQGKAQPCYCLRILPLDCETSDWWKQEVLESLAQMEVEIHLKKGKWCRSCPC